MTKQRALINEIIQHSAEHLTADEIFAIAQQQMPAIARGTVYRNLKLMAEDGEIRRLEMPNGPDRYDKTNRSHGHLYCDGCGSLTDIPVIGLVRELEAAIGTEVRSYTLTVHYLCDKCRMQPAE